METAMDGGIALANGLLLGPWVRPRNVSSNLLGSIPEETTARALGMGGALVTGRVLIVAFAPLLRRAFGERWFEQGTLSIDFRSGVLDGDELRAVLGEPPAGADSVQVQARLERPSGEVVARGTASVGAPSELTYLGGIDPARYDTGAYEMLGSLAPGERFPDVDVTMTDAQARRWEAALPSLPWCSDASPWGGPIASPAVATTALAAGCTAYRQEHPVAGVAVDGAIELRNVKGPMLLSQSYRVSGAVIGRGHSPRTEYVWYESALDDESGRRIAEMRMKLRFMSHPTGALACTHATS